MTQDDLKRIWLAEEDAAHIHGWDFSHIHGRYTEEDDLPWDYEALVRQALRPEAVVLDYDTGGGEFLLSLGHPYQNTAATEGYPPNVALCSETLLPLGIDFRPCGDPSALPFAENSFDLVLNRHGDFDPEELYRVLKPGGLFLTEQVGAENDRELVDLLLPGTPLPFPNLYLKHTVQRFCQAGFTVTDAREAFRPIRFFDVGALVWFARIIEWEFPNFSVERCLDRLYEAQRIIQEDGWIQGRIHRFFLAARKDMPLSRKSDRS